MRLIVFDMDDTLYPEAEYVRSGFGAVADYVGRNLDIPSSRFLDACLRAYEDEGSGRVFNVAVSETGLGADVVPKLVDVYRTHRPRIKLYPGMHDLLSDLRLTSRTAVLSDGHLTAQEQKAVALHLASLVDEVLLTDAFGRDAWKPSPQCFEVLTCRFGIGASDASYVGDNLNKDFIAPNALGWQTVRLRLPGQLHYAIDTTKRDAAQTMVESIADLRSLLLPQ
jgi:putative hydrolase of the HAD superfamily